MVQEILVVGGGPAGLVSATEAAISGAETTVIEEDKEIGRPDHCAGLVSREGLERILVGYERVVLSRIRRVRLFSPKGRMYEVSLPGDKAVVIDREMFDVELMKKMEMAGAKVLTEKPYDPSMEFKVMINAEGVKGRVGKMMGFEVPWSIPAAQVDVEVKNFEDDVVEVYTGEWSPGFFVWAVPRRDHLRVGLASAKGMPKELLNRFLEKNENFKRKEVLRVVRELWGKVVLGGPLRNTVRGNVVAVGDAGGFVKPTTGGGVVFGCLTAKLAGRFAAEAVCKGGELQGFEREWKRLYLKEFNKMKLVAKIFRNMRDNELESVLTEAYSEGLIERLASYDMDLQGAIVDKLLKTKLIRCAILPFLRSLF
ncbi:MAG: lycopene cyclase family protein [Candidatus Methanomethylicaceae archaeon]